LTHHINRGIPVLFAIENLKIYCIVLVIKPTGNLKIIMDNAAIPLQTELTNEFFLLKVNSKQLSKLTIFATIPMDGFLI